MDTLVLAVCGIPDSTEVFKRILENVCPQSGSEDSAKYVWLVTVNT